MADNDASAVHAEMYKDVKRAKELYLQSKSPYEARAYLRAMFVLVETSLFSIQELLKDQSIPRKHPLAFEELAALREQSIALTSNGTIRPRPQPFPLKEKTRFLLNLAANVYGLSAYSIDFTNHGWRELRKTIDKRNEMTHPKTLNSINVTDEHIATVETGSEWLSKCWEAVFRAYIDGVIKHLGDLEEDLTDRIESGKKLKSTLASMSQATAEPT